jgi:hypothetical protein
MSAFWIHLVAWFGLVLLAIINGLVRENTFGRVLSTAASHAASSFLGLALFAIAVALLHRWRPLPNATQAWLVGIAWVLATVVFEAGMGRMRGMTWPQLTAMYDISAGSLWPLLLAATLALPPLFTWLSRLP